MIRKRRVCYQIMALVLVLALIVPILAACGSDNKKETTTPAATMPPKTTPAATTPNPTVSNEPVKIGFMCDWSGPGAMAGWLADGTIAFAEWHWNQKQGGIQVGDVRRPVKFIKYDNKSQVALASAVTKKAVLDGCVAVVGGGVVDQFAYPIADVTDPATMLYVTYHSASQIFTDYKYTVGSFFDGDARNANVADLIVNKLKAKTVGILAADQESTRQNMQLIKDLIKPLDPEVKFVYEQYHAADVTDFSPYLTRIKYNKPDVLLMESTLDAFSAIAKQMMGLGGWGKIQLVSRQEAAQFPDIENAPGANGWIIPIMWLPDTGTTAQIAFGKDWAEKCSSDPGWCKQYSPTGSVPLPNYAVMYNPILTAIKAIELAGTDDRAQVAKAARSGKLEFDSTEGYLKIGTDGKTNLRGFWAQVKDGKIMPY